MTKLDPLVVAQLDALAADESNPITILSNASALLNASMPRLNWCGFYFYSKKTQTLDLGPFQGQVACTHIQPGKGVVGTCYADQKPLIVPNVHEFAGHIACDAASNSEVVVPLIKDGNIFGVLDIDSPDLDRFSQDEEQVLSDFADTLSSHLDTKALELVY